MDRDSRQAEKEYLQRTGSSAWERSKPFSHAGADTLAESAGLLHDFAVAMMELAPAPDDLILDLGAGGCWCSDLLGRLHRKSVAIDISTEMLQVGRSRPTGAHIRAVAGDLQALPFRTGSFRHALCFNALHHVPDMRAAIGEIARVLADDGVAMFSEPGRGHARAAGSAAAMRDFGVLEQEVLIDRFARDAQASGFRDVRVKMLSHAVPRVDLTAEDFDALGRYVSTKRPVRALKTILRASAEFFGLGKRTFLLGETFAISVMRATWHASEDHPIIVASKAPRESVRIVERRARIDIEATERARRLGAIPVRATVVNLGNVTWVASSAGKLGDVRLGVQLLTSDQRLLSRDFHRVSLPANVAPGDRIELMFSCPAPDAAGDYALKFDLVAEGVTWFEAEGSEAAVHRLTID